MTSSATSFHSRPAAHEPSRDRSVLATRAPDRQVWSHALRRLPTARRSDRALVATDPLGRWSPPRGAWSIGDAARRSIGGVAADVAIAAWLVWGVGVVALVVPSTLGLTVMRMSSALSCGAAVVSWIGGARPVPARPSSVCAVIGALFVGGADFGQRCVQASAYGDEQPLPAPCPRRVLVAGGASPGWCGWLRCSPRRCCWDRRQWVIGGAVAVAAVLLDVARWCRGSTRLPGRWLVLVPAGPRGARPGRARRDLDGGATPTWRGSSWRWPARRRPISPARPARSCGRDRLARRWSTRNAGTDEGARREAQRSTCRSFLVAPTRPGAVLRAATTRI